MAALLKQQMTLTAITELMETTHHLGLGRLLEVVVVALAAQQLLELPELAVAV
jgi:hypothetical protein